MDEMTNVNGDRWRSWQDYMIRERLFFGELGPADGVLLVVHRRVVHVEISLGERCASAAIAAVYRCPVRVKAMPNDGSSSGMGHSQRWLRWRRRIPNLGERSCIRHLTSERSAQ
jgi:hypothetical protein